MGHSFRADAGEEELLLDALSVCSCALAVLAAELSAAALLEAGLLPEEVSLRAVIAPYKLRLSIMQVSRATNGCEFIANWGGQAKHARGRVQ